MLGVEQAQAAQQDYIDDVLGSYEDLGIKEDNEDYEEDF